MFHEAKIPLAAIGLSAAILSICLDSLIGKNIYLLVAVLVILEGALNAFLFKELKKTMIMTLLLIPYCVLAGNFFLVAGFLSAFLLIMIFVGGNKGKESDDFDYYGNSNQSRY